MERIWNQELLRLAPARTMVIALVLVLIHALGHALQYVFVYSVLESKMGFVRWSLAVLITLMLLATMILQPSPHCKVASGCDVLGDDKSRDKALASAVVQGKHWLVLSLFIVSTLLLLLCLNHDWYVWDSMQGTRTQLAPWTNVWTTQDTMLLFACVLPPLVLHVGQYGLLACWVLFPHGLYMLLMLTHSTCKREHVALASFGLALNGAVAYFREQTGRSNWALSSTVDGWLQYHDLRGTVTARDAEEQRRYYDA